MTRGIVLLAVWLATTSCAAAAWRISESPNDVPDLPVQKSASLEANESASPVTGRLWISCIDLSGDRYVSLTLSERQPGRGSVSWRLDAEPVQHEDVPNLVQSYSSAKLALEPTRLAHAKHVHAEWLTASGRLLSYDFDLAGAEEAIAQIPCVKIKGGGP